ncbi:glycosyltransferase family 8 protein [Pseudaestuariivita rosea]|uniref:glycosyltransferase family 8 protein n=1 Tax=Pseudaestuariivita rosea TaxID=2763263 RepID=UPI001ABA5326|nr:glycosyltransferase family 8 protein [Pseudaestuariivita rosea]
MGGRPHIVYFFDRGFEACSLVSLYTVLKTKAQALQVTLHATDPSDHLPGLVRKLLAHFDTPITLDHLNLEDYDHLPRGRLPLAARARLLLPKLHEGRVLYIDGDCIARRDVTELWHQDLAGKCVGAVLAPGIMVDLQKAQNTGSRAAQKRADKQRKRGLRLDGIDMSRYFNSGVMVFDLDRINAVGLADHMMDIEATAKYTSRDQDWLNMVFRDQVHYLDPIWNSGWGNPKTCKHYISDDIRKAWQASREAPAILHFTGFEKPWLHEKPPFRFWLIHQPQQRKDRAKYWAEFQMARRECEVILGRTLFDG